MKKHLVVAIWLDCGERSPPRRGGGRPETWPARPVKMIVGFAPGGPTDLFARLIAQKLTDQTGKNFFIENVPGAGGNVGAGRAAQSAPDGYTVLVTGGNITNNPYLFGHTAYDPLKDFDAVTLGAATPMVLAINPSVPVHIGQGAGRPDPLHARQIQLRIAGHGHAAATGRGAVRARVEPRPRARAVWRRRTGRRATVGVIRRSRSARWRRRCR